MCPFCPPSLDEQRIRVSNGLCLFLTSGDPVLVGSGIIVPRAHRRDVFELSPEEWAASFQLLGSVRATLDRELAPDGYNIGWNCRAVAGQEILHAHMHVIPRFGDEPLAGRGIRHWLKQEVNRRRSVAQPSSGVTRKRSEQGRVRIGSIVIRCHEYPRMVEFWQAALDYEVEHTDPKGGFVILRDPDGRGPNVSLDQAPTPRAGKRGWLHLDLYTTSQDREVERLLELGARRYPWRYSPGADYVVLEDPDGNLFCVVQLRAG
jgi:diadenosine tetraphosphate (Ap4A) HIT family hydrolase/catechol 2,3-dioxygenase-like lactoylglutathione lyase family enzyme